ncbi:DUF4297 family anti-phage-associated protein [Marinobacter sp. LN3S78]|uniref:DUF4297 family anti-phage-associated protein n=1 Tax=Marinobacter sp. LN3S78 TaxID=3382300 RepID=UPI00387B9015
MPSREAIDTITGYFYQFDKTILEILKQTDNQNSVCVEGIEDIDIVNPDNTSAIQCKYYAKTKYNHSVIKEAVVMMLRHFAKNRSAGINYHLYGHYASGHEKLPELSCDFLKEKFLTYKKTEKNEKDEVQQVTYRVYEELALTDDDLEEFLGLLELDINAPSMSEQYSLIIENIKVCLNVSHSEAELYHYNSALKVIKSLSMEQDRDKRKISKSDFLDRISAKDEIFDAWFIKRKGREKYLQSIKREFLSSRLNMEPFNRFFLIDCQNSQDLSLINETVRLIAKKWSKISKRQSPCFCPAIYINGLSDQERYEIKNSIYFEGMAFLDPYPFRGSRLSSEHFYTDPSADNKIRFRFIDSVADLKILVDQSPVAVEIYQFYIDNPYYSDVNNKHVRIKIEDLSYVRDLNK